MAIELGLKRIRKLLSYLGNPHVSSYKSVHIAGTNGKGSTIAYLSLILTHAKISNGRFTSPHLLSYNDCISINNQTYSLHKFEKVRNSVLSHNARYNLGCTEFEILTATAFKIFEIEQVELALIEVGLGGRLDATNVLTPYANGNTPGGVIVCGITKIGIDHEGFLGNTITDIAREKAGIIKTSVPVVVDHTNQRQALDEIARKAAAVNAPLFSTEKSMACEIDNPIQYSPMLGQYQTENLSVALHIVATIQKTLKSNELTRDCIISGIRNTYWPGRLQRLQDKTTGIEFLLDGAHNECASMELGNYLRSIRRKGFIFVVGMSEGKSVEGLLKHIALKDNDVLIPFHFTAPPEMPWVKCHDVENISMTAKDYVEEVLKMKNADNIADLFDFLAARKNNGDVRQVVICGSLYLCSDILRHQIDLHQEPEQIIELEAATKYE
ncbi:FolC bifunctional protein [Metschnikowia bicuspidata var. bicuspidata NRRL YB-4993]|uniref:Dihydrofolate synthetase n=1 Tax=Metschnikowia bicuspidata var. bicuspidata NRRL YB-4993 TaxID=869754 RepID=A0A1A0HBE1_9ASCO|nr:FolC bifunctional protein [Metschnikowia bicuspidata var. bicuspidata NRRL YB-4993]OBA21192.1 FolC bifunctional protein [Metschnikowia bicuspidata var. bicuspidata NRRL YB-4993]